MAGNEAGHLIDSVRVRRKCHLDGSGLPGRHIHQDVCVLMVSIFSGFFAAMMIGLTLLQLLMAWSSQTIADKNDLPEWAGILAWIPLANMYPVVRCGGWSFVTFLKVAAVCIALMIGLGTIAALSGGEGGAPAIVSLGLFAVLLVVFVSFVQLMWRTARPWSQASIDFASTTGT